MACLTFFGFFGIQYPAGVGLASGTQEYGIQMNLWPPFESCDRSRTPCGLSELGKFRLMIVAMSFIGQYCLNLHRK